METQLSSLLPQEQQERSLFLFVVVVGYIVTFTVASSEGIGYSATALLLGIICGVVYLIVGVFDTELLGRFSANIRSLAFFSIEIALVLGIGWTLGPGGNWLIGLPLAGIAVERLSLRSRWFVYGGLLAAIILPILRYSTWDVALMNSFTISAAIFFVAIFTQSRVNERQARRSAEQLALQIEAANRRLAEYASQAEELAAAQERNRLAHEIHDSLGHHLTVANVQIEAAKVTMVSDPSRALDALTKARDSVKQGLASVRRSVSALRVSPVENRPLDAAIAALIEGSQTRRSLVHFTVLGARREVNEDVALAFYRAVQEGLTNVRKHAKATCVDVELDYSVVDQLFLRVRDNGIGATETDGGFGLLGIRERVHLLGGGCRVETKVGKGFCLEVTVPVRQEGHE